MTDGSPVLARVLGPLEVTVSGRPVLPGGPRQRALLALLVARAGRLVSLPTLAEGLWGPTPPADADRTVRVYVSRLRKALAAGPELIGTHPVGYVLRLDRESVDSGRFEALLAAGRQELAAGRPVAARERLVAALDLWRGDAYEEFDSAAVLRTEADRLAGLRLTAIESRIEAELATGSGGDLVPELVELTARHPGHEGLWGQLMIALYRAGRQADALAAYQRARELLIEESGLEPSPALVAVHGRILAQDPTLLPAPAPAVPAAAAPERPAQLPRVTGTFTGRARELARLDGLLAAADGTGSATTVVIAAVGGTAGVGKTALALRWGHSVADSFPDGQLYLNLRGFDPGARALDPAEAVRSLLDALGVPAGRIPLGLDAQAALYRTRIAGRRMLVVLDNARDAEQARPLLPGDPAAMVVVTSRDHLTALVAEGAQPLVLDTLSEAEAYELMARRLGPARVGAEPAAVADIIAACARLPLALAIAAARAATRPDFPLTALAAELNRACGRLDALSTGDPATDIRAVFSWSYRALSPPARRLFRLLGLHPGPDIAAPAAAGLAGEPLPATRALLAELVRANLLTEHAPGRFTSHDLLRAYAVELGRDEDPDERAVAVQRLVEHHVHTAHAAHRLLHPAGDRIALPLTPPSPGAAPQDFTDRQQAVTWLRTEYPAAVATVRLAVDAELPRLGWQLAWALDTFLTRQGRWSDVITIWETALATDRVGDPGARAHGHRLLANAFTRLRRFPAAHEHYARALDLDEPDDDLGHAHTYHALAYLLEQEDRTVEALAHAGRAYDLFRAAGHERGQAYALNATGWYRTLTGDHRRALADCTAAVALNQRAGDQSGEAFAVDSLGYVHQQLADHDAALAAFRRAVALFRTADERHGESIALTHLGESCDAVGEFAAARDAWQAALRIVTDLELAPEVADLSARLARLRDLIPLA